MNHFLRMKSWQVFALVVLLPIILQFVLMAYYKSDKVHELEVMFEIFPILMVIFLATFMSWFWSLGTELNKIVKERIRPNPRFFKFGIIYATLYMLVFMYLVSTYVGMRELEASFAFIIPFHVLAFICMFYGLYFITKNLVMAEKNEQVSFSDIVGTFFLIWFYPVGIWFIQPRVNKLIEQQDD